MSEQSTDGLRHWVRTSYALGFTAGLLAAVAMALVESGDLLLAGVVASPAAASVPLLYYATN